MKKLYLLLKENLCKSTLILTSMFLFLKIHRIFELMTCLLAFSLIAEEYKERIVIEDFESIKLTEPFLKVPANDNYLPEIRVSKNLTSPDLQSNASLLLRTPAGAIGIPMDLLFTKPYKLEEYVIEFEFYVYSNNANGDLFLYLLDAKFEKHRIRIANLNYDGWKNFKVSIGNLVAQSNFIIGKPSSIKLVGLHVNLSQKETKNKEDIIAIDDIYVVQRRKHKLPVNGLAAFH